MKRPDKTGLGAFDVQRLPSPSPQSPNARTERRIAPKRDRADRHPAGPLRHEQRAGSRAYPHGLDRAGRTTDRVGIFPAFRTFPRSGCGSSRDCVARIEGRVAELPGRRARKPQRRRRVQMLVVLSQGEVLLQKRPPSGIWGGLWSLPEVDEGLDPARALRSRWGLAAASAEALPRLRARVHALHARGHAVAAACRAARRPRPRAARSGCRFRSSRARRCLRP